MKDNRTKRVALRGMLFALAMVLSVLEGVITPALGLPPGVKLGLANIVVMYALFAMSTKDALYIVVLKALFSGLVRGMSAGVLSLAGGVLSLFVMWFIMRVDKKPSYLILSVSGAIAHNFGQLLALQWLFTQNVYTLYYAPVLLISGLVMGIGTSASLKAILPALHKLNVKP